MTSLDGRCDNDAHAVSGIMLGSELPMVVPLSRTLAHYVVSHFVEVCLSKQNADARFSSQNELYGIVESFHLHAAILKLNETKARWKTFTCFVTVFNGRHSMEAYRAMRRMQNLQKSAKHNISHTFFDTLHNLPEDFKRLRGDGCPHSAPEVVKAFNGNSLKRFQTLAHIARVSILPPLSVIHTFEENSNSERPDTVLKNTSLNKTLSQTVEQVLKQVDCRI